ncbi:MAG: hypothetical protein KDH15_16490 [Rhodocyclaceae bacterium]|nr:hypothetical protein [Rhodocyclaceae bacterium]
MSRPCLVSASAVLAAVLLSACTNIPAGPSVLVLPGTGKSFQQFRSDEQLCRRYASDLLGGKTPDGAAVDAGIRSAAVGAVLGAAVGAAADGGHGAATGAGVGLAAGGLIGTGTGSASGYGTQNRYDNAFIQCMYASGHRVPVSGAMTGLPRSGSQRYYPPPPPPPGSAPLQ